MKHLLMLSLFYFSCQFLSAQASEKSGISTAIQDGNAKALSAYFTPSVDLRVLDAESVYSKDQAEVILARFFNEHKPSIFVVKHEGKSKLDDYFYIGELKAAEDIYRLTFFLKKEQATFKIKQLRIENN